MDKEGPNTDVDQRGKTWICELRIFCLFRMGGEGGGGGVGWGGGGEGDLLQGRKWGQKAENEGGREGGREGEGMERKKFVKSVSRPVPPFRD